MYASPPLTGMTYWRSPAGGTQPAGLVVHVLPWSLLAATVVQPTQRLSYQSTPSDETARSGSALGKGAVGLASFSHVEPFVRLTYKAPEEPAPFVKSTP